MAMLFSQFPKITQGEWIAFSHDEEVLHWVIDSRKANALPGAVFFCLLGKAQDGHAYIEDAYQRGVRYFVVHEQPKQLLPEVAYFLVNNTLTAIQQIAAYHRAQFQYPVIGITGSNGKTILKEWLFQLLSPDKSIVKNPGSYNSQVGVPLSVWQMKSIHELAIFEAGISTISEMENLEKVIQPTIGILTNIGAAHDEGFLNTSQKLEEKVKLFRHVSVLVYCRDNAFIHSYIQTQNIPSLTWGFDAESDIVFTHRPDALEVNGHGYSFAVRLPFHDEASIQNVCHAITTLLYLGVSSSDIQQRVQHLKTVPMRLELKDGIHHAQIIDDTYNNDLVGLKISLDFLQRQQRKRKTFILSDVLQTGLEPKELLHTLNEIIQPYQVNRFIGVGDFFTTHERDLKMAHEINVFPTTEKLLDALENFSFHDELVLIKGARHFQFEKIVRRLQRQAHGTVMEVDLNKLAANLNYFKSKLKPNVKLMVMVKALAYGSGSEEIAGLLQYHHIDYLGVAYADEGVELRKKEIRTPIMVMNTAPDNFESLWQYQLEPVMFNLRTLKLLLEVAEGRSLPIHIELETGMQRLGFSPPDFDELISILHAHPQLKVVSIFSHLAGSDDEALDDFSSHQANLFLTYSDTICKKLNQQPLRHLINSAGILRLPQYQLDMVRLGIGLYGINPTNTEDKLKLAVTLKTVISQIKHVPAGESIGYGRKSISTSPRKIATLAIGYADGFNRAFSNGKGNVLIRGKLASVVGNVCMDMTMVDVSQLDAHEGDEAIIFGDALPIRQVAAWMNTIPYEVLTQTSERVKRVYYTESV